MVKHHQEMEREHVKVMRTLERIAELQSIISCEISQIFKSTVHCSSLTIVGFSWYFGFQSFSFLYCVLDRLFCCKFHTTNSRLQTCVDCWWVTLLQWILIELNLMSLFRIVLSGCAMLEKFTLQYAGDLPQYASQISWQIRCLFVVLGLIILGYTVATYRDYSQLSYEMLTNMQKPEAILDKDTSQLHTEECST